NHDIWVIADEVYSQIIFDEEFISIASLPGMKERTIIVDGFSKTYAMTGWRLGYGVMPRELAVQVAKIETNIDSCTCAFTQIAGVHALDGPQHESQYMIGQFKERAKVIVEGLNGIAGVRCLPAQGAFYVFPNVTGACRKLGLKSANELQRALLHEAGVAVLPRTCFGRRNEGEAEEYIRLSFATSMENIREGLRRMKQFIER
ncbi:MAG: aminotransferase class I/II-fold pyridoxal phosphate-dependent enzyme, partial [bacterium]|nr:aminotransferase class I/II-fold pyridoxal phosphate-dependent enzyme [bacterium]